MSTSFLDTPGQEPGVFIPTNTNVSEVMDAGFPVELYDYQKAAVDELGHLWRVGLYLSQGTGKTFTSLAITHLKFKRGEVDCVLVVVPPILLVNWKRSIDLLPDTSSVIYAGTPAQRKKIDLNVKYIVVSLPIFKRDYRVFQEFAADKRCFVILDEAQSIKNPGTDNFRKIRDFTIDNGIALLTGTPVSVPEDAYGLIKLVSPPVYRSQYQFESIHVSERDWLSNKPTAYANLDLLRENLMLNSVRILAEDVLKDLPEVTYTPLYYDLHPSHLKLYRRIAEEQLLLLDNGEKMDFTLAASSLYQALQQVVMGAEHFSSGELKSTGLEVIDQVLDELGDKKLVVFCHYRRTTSMLLERYESIGVRAIWGATPSGQRQPIIDSFISDPERRLLVLQLASGSAGIDGLQGACSDILFIELPYMSTTFRQACARIHRIGQKERVHVRIAVAQKTLQESLFTKVMDRDELVNSVVHGPEDLRKSIFPDS